MAFHRTNITDDTFIRGAARLLSAPITQPFPDSISDIIVLASGSAQYDAASGWTDLGATKTGVQITVNNAEETFDVDQITGDIASLPTSWECSVGTQFAEADLEHLALAWEGSTIDTDTAPDVDERVLGVGTPDTYTQRRLAVLHQRNNGKIRAYIFRQVQRTPQEASVTHAKTGEQVTIPVRFRALADDDVSDIKSRFFVIRDQV